MTYILNLELNFVENSDFRLGNYEMALKGFENAIRAKNDHALAYYYAAKCCEKLGDSEKAQRYMNSAHVAAQKPFGANMWICLISPYSCRERLYRQRHPTVSEQGVGSLLCI